MALPKLNVPVYEAILPSTEKVIKYRPFLKVEKMQFSQQSNKLLRIVFKEKLM